MGDPLLPRGLVIEPLTKNKRSKPNKESYTNFTQSEGVHPQWLVWLCRGLGAGLGYAVIVFAVLFLMARNGWSSYVEGLKPLILIGPVYFFTLYRPAFFPPVIVLVLGLILDLFLGTPLGLTSGIALLVQFVVMRQARVIREFPTLMITVLAVVPITAAELLRWVAVSVLSTELQPLYPALIAALWGMVIYLVLSLVFYKVLRLISIR